jgi:hypothetical protein
MASWQAGDTYRRCRVENSPTFLTAFEVCPLRRVLLMSVSSKRNKIHCDNRLPRGRGYVATIYGKKRNKSCDRVCQSALHYAKENKLGRAVVVGAIIQRGFLMSSNWMGISSYGKFLFLATYPPITEVHCRKFGSTRTSGVIKA